MREGGGKKGRGWFCCLYLIPELLTYPSPLPLFYGPHSLLKCRQGADPNLSAFFAATTLPFDQDGSSATHPGEKADICRLPMSGVLDSPTGQARGGLGVLYRNFSRPRLRLDFHPRFLYNACKAAGGVETLGASVSTASSICEKNTGRSALAVVSALRAALASKLGTKQLRTMRWSKILRKHLTSQIDG